ncbi:MAG: hypothetical protein AB2556_25860 [Candidatus Thiodiazotropha sp.]
MEVLGGIKALQAADAPLLCSPGAEQTTAQKKKNRLATLVTAVVPVALQQEQQPLAT